MPKFKVGYSFDGDDFEDVVDLGTQKEADEYAREQALERVSYWAEPITAEETK